VVKAWDRAANTGSSRPDASRAQSGGAEPDGAERNTLRTSSTRRRVVQVAGDKGRERTDMLAVEEPLEIRLYPPGDAPYVRVSVTMRTPGHDFELAAGFLYTEGILRHADDVRAISYCTDPDLDGEQRYNIANVFVRPEASVDLAQLQRNFYTTSSCGVCGKASIEAIHVRGICPVADDGFAVSAEVLGLLGERLRGSQRVFEKTGGLHAAGLFDAKGQLQVLREDVGRHNAVDKLIGEALLGRRLPLRHRLMMVSGRASFEIVQKAAAAGIPVVVAVSAPSSLACDTAEAFGVTLVGFARGARFSVYTGPARILLDGSPPAGRL
jgi:FdhD protein